MYPGYTPAADVITVRFQQTLQAWPSETNLDKAFNTSKLNGISNHCIAKYRLGIHSKSKFHRTPRPTTTN
jgi:hypothetical protein